MSNPIETFALLIVVFGIGIVIGRHSKRRPLASRRDEEGRFSK
jgi:hypothetical protein